MSRLDFEEIEKAKMEKATMKIDHGKYYRTRDGRKVGPMKGDGSFDKPAFIELCGDGRGWWPSGEMAGPAHDGDETLIAEWTDEPEAQPDRPKLWRDMTELEQLRLKVAHHEGEVIEFCYNYDGDWRQVTPRWASFNAYRIRPEPKRETVIGEWCQKFGWRQHSGTRRTHRITFDLIDGEPDLASIRMEFLA